METPEDAPRKLGRFTRALFKLTGGVDEETLAQCPAHDVECLTAIAVLLLVVWIYQTMVLSLVAHKLFVHDGQIHPGLIAGAAFIGWLVMLIDAHVFLRAGYHADGIRELARGGLDLAGGAATKIKAAFFLVIRIALSLCSAALMGIFMGLIIFQDDVASEIDLRYRQENAALIAKATNENIADVGRSQDAMKAEQGHVTALENQIAAMRTGAVNPAANDAAVQSEQKEIDQLLNEKSQRDKELADAQAFASDELAGKSGDGHSGVIGRGPVREAAEERVQTAAANDDAAARALADARSRLDDLTKQISSNASGRSDVAQQQLPQMEKELADSTAELARLRDDLTKLTENRDAAVEAAVEKAPDHIERDDGLLGQLRALKEIASRDPEIKAVIILIDLASFGLELAAVLAKVTAFIPTTYAALLARNGYLNAVRIAEEVVKRVNGGKGSDAESEDDADFLPPIASSGDDSPDDPDEPDFSNGHDENPPAQFGAGALPGDAAAPPKRPRGRPRKHPPAS